jgi:hypothetical protein
MPKMPPGGENRKSAGESDVSKGSQPQKVAQIERVGGKGEGAHSFNVPNHPEHCHVSGPKGSAD